MAKLSMSGKLSYFDNGKTIEVNVIDVNRCAGLLDIVCQYDNGNYLCLCYNSETDTWCKYVNNPDEPYSALTEKFDNVLDFHYTFEVK